MNNNDDDGRQLKCLNSMHFHNSVLHYLYTMADGFVIYVKARAFKAKAINSRPRPKINIHVISSSVVWRWKQM